MKNQRFQQHEHDKIPGGRRVEVDTKPEIISQNRTRGTQYLGGRGSGGFGNRGGATRGGGRIAF